MSTIIYYFTGTGNSLKIAKDLQAGLPDVKLVRICKANEENCRDGKAENVGFVFPVYYRGLPRMMERFVGNLPADQETYYFAVANYGSNAALSFRQLDDLLNSKGARLSAAFGVPMPGNMWFMYYPHPKEDFSNRIEAQSETTQQIIREIQNRRLIPLADVANANAEEAMYTAFQPSKLDQDFWADHRCSSCGICSKVCPASNIKMVDNRPIWQHRCEFCLACIHWCPCHAIEYKTDSVNKERYHHPYIKVDELFQS